MGDGELTEWRVRWTVGGVERTSLAMADRPLATRFADSLGRNQSVTGLVIERRSVTQGPWGVI